MSKYLTIIRHAKSSWENSALDDIIRPLNERGIESIKIIGNYLKDKEIQPDFVLTSPATRALQTAIGIGKYLNFDTDDLHIKQDIYYGSEKEILDVICTIDEHFTDVFLFGHEPILSSLIELLTKEKLEKFPTCAVYRIRFNINNWKNITSTKANCEFYVNPKLLIKK